MGCIHVEACPSQSASGLYAYRLEAQLGALDGRHVASWTSSNDADVILGISHGGRRERALVPATLVPLFAINLSMSDSFFFSFLFFFFSFFFFVVVFWFLLSVFVLCLFFSPFLLLSWWLVVERGEREREEEEEEEVRRKRGEEKNRNEEKKKKKKKKKRLFRGGILNLLLGSEKESEKESENASCPGRI